MKKTIRTSCPRDCYDGCGVLAEIRDDAAPRILGDPKHPVTRGRLCSKCAIAYNGVWQDSDSRLNYPLRRIGDKGSAKYERISWDFALEEIATNLNRIIQQDGAEKILHTHYTGTLSLIAYKFPDRFFNYLGASVVDPDSICNAAGHVAWNLLFGNSLKGFDPRTAKDSNCILVWGANPSHSAPHAHEHWLEDSPAKIIVIDPIYSESAATADLHLQLKPGSDAALAFGLLHVLRELGKFDESYIDDHTLGADEIVETIDRCDPQWTHSQTGIPVELLVNAAEIYGTGPSLLWCGQGLQRQPNGGNIMRAIGLLPSLTGNIGKPGAGFCYLNFTPGMAGINWDTLGGAGLCKQPGKTISHMDLATRLANPDEFKALITWNTNPLASAADQGALRKAVSRTDLFTVVIDCFPTDTAAYADIVLPAASFLEFDDITWSYFHLHIGAQAKVMEPVGESLPNQEIFRRLARKMNLVEPTLFEDDETLIDRMMMEMNVGLDFAGLKSRGHFYISDDPILMFENGKFETTSGKIEIASNTAEALGLPRTPQPSVDRQTKDGHFRLLTPASKWRLNDSYANDPTIARRAGPATALINETDAARIGATDGSRLRLRNVTGSIDLVAQVDANVLAGVVISYKGRWPSLEGGAVNVNSVHTPIKTDMGESSSVHATEVIVEVL